MSQIISFQAILKSYWLIVFSSQYSVWLTVATLVSLGSAIVSALQVTIYCVIDLKMKFAFSALIWLVGKAVRFV